MCRFCVVFTLIMMIVAYLRETNPNESLKIDVSVENQMTSNGGVVQSVFVSESHSNPPDVVMHCTKSAVPKKTFVDEIVECFSLRKNVQTLVDTSKPANAVPIVDGLK